jgi:hypothetical protein
MPGAGTQKHSRFARSDFQSLPTFEPHKKGFMSKPKIPPQTPPAASDVADLISDDRLISPKTSQIANVMEVGGNSAANAEQMPAAQANAQQDAAAKEAGLRPKNEVYMGDAKAVATKSEIEQAVASVLGQQLDRLIPDPVKQAEMMAGIVDKIVRGLREPSDEEKASIAKRKADRAKLIQEQFEMIAQQKEIRDMCPHERGTADGKSHSTVTAIHNYPDGKVRGICNMCQDIIEPGDEDYRLVLISHQQQMQSA